MSEVLYTRYSDGARPVRELSDGWELVDYDGVTKLYGTRHAVLSELGHPTWSWDRYFRLGIYAPKNLGTGSVLDLFGEPITSPVESRVVLAPLAPRLITLRSSSLVTVPDEGVYASPVVLDPALGIDLKNRHDEVRKLLFAGFGRQIFASGYDAEDVLQEVFRGILARNQGKCPWDPGKSSFGHYVHMVCSCVVKNYHRKHNRVSSHEQTGIRYMQDDGYQTGDVSGATNLPATPTLEHQSSELNEAAHDLAAFMLSRAGRHDVQAAQLAVQLIPHMASGKPRREMASELGVSMSVLTRAVGYLRDAAVEWQAAMS